MISKKVILVSGSVVFNQVDGHYFLHPVGENDVRMCYYSHVVHIFYVEGGEKTQVYGHTEKKKKNILSKTFGISKWIFSIASSFFLMNQTSNFRCLQYEVTVVDVDQVNLQQMPKLENEQSKVEDIQLSRSSFLSIDVVEVAAVLGVVVEKNSYRQLILTYFDEEAVKVFCHVGDLDSRESSYSWLHAYFPRPFSTHRWSLQN